MPPRTPLLDSRQFGDVFVDVGECNPIDNDVDRIGSVRVLCFAAVESVFCFCELLTDGWFSTTGTTLIAPVLPGVFTGKFVGAGVPPSDAGRRDLFVPARADLDRQIEVDDVVVLEDGFLLPTTATSDVVQVVHDALTSVLELHVATLSHEAASVVDPARRPFPVPPAARGIAPPQVNIIDSHPAGPPPPSIPMRLVADTASRLIAAVGRRRTTDVDVLDVSTLS